MRKLLLILLFLISCQDYNYKGLRVKFIDFRHEDHYYSGKGLGKIYSLKYRILRGNKHHSRNEIIIENIYEYDLKRWMIKRKLGKRFTIRRDGYPISIFLYY